MSIGSSLLISMCNSAHVYHRSMQTLYVKQAVTAILAILVETAANLLAAELGTHLPTGAAATLTLIPALILFLALSRRLEH